MQQKGMLASGGFHAKKYPVLIEDALFTFF